jgi:hypothetical protein
MTDEPLSDRLAEGRAAMISVIRDGQQMNAAAFADRYPHPFLLLAETGAGVADQTGMRTLLSEEQQQQSSAKRESRTAEDLLWGVTPRDEAAERVTAGRAQDNDIVLAFNLVSKQHLAFEETGRGWKLIDMGSSNGTSLNGDALQSLHAYDLQDGDVIDVGSELSVTFMQPESLHVVLPALGRILEK